ncbi:outer membrane protein assembly factor BamD [Stenotrophomonas maltophilia]|uniref:outer membrane protein assembly factor BamD n=1 Tax=Stenotrophomonas maltophilia TaxID=40324 RepID=UPI001F0D32CF|nr:outer membrane protein assembly factor BamD [Stenotrophomonas maltophilia]
MTADHHADSELLDDETLEKLQALETRAYAAFDEGDLIDAADLFGELIERTPCIPHLHYMRGLAYKYLRDWPASLRDNLRSEQLRETFDQATAWNAGIAASGASDWAEARRQWNRCGIAVPEGEGPIDGNFGVACVRLNPWSSGETVYMRRLDPVRARVENVPLPESGFRFGDIVLHDGASTGKRIYGEREVPVFNAMQRLQQSDMATYAVFVQCDAAEDIAALRQLSLPGIGLIEDWTHSVRHLCLRCSYGTPHLHGDGDGDGDGDADDDDGWERERNLGIAAQGRAAVEKLMAVWTKAGAGRVLDAIEQREHPLQDPEPGQVWWLGEEDEDEAP